MNFKSFEFDVKSVDDSGTFTGYGSVFGNIDGGNEIVVKGAFAESLAARVAKGRKLPILWQHRSGEPIGVYESVKEDDHGLLMTGRLLINDVQRAKEAYALMKAGAVTGMSIGYTVMDDQVDAKTRTRYLKKLGLEETSIVTFPMNDEARVEVVKSRLDGCASLKEIETLLREAGGFSRGDATALVARIKSLTHGDRDVEVKTALEVRQLLETFSL